MPRDDHLFVEEYMKKQIFIGVPSGFLEYQQAACIRLGYLFPELVFCGTKEGVMVDYPEDIASPSEAEVRKEILHQLYRERVYTETLSIRKWLNSNE